MSEKTPAKAGEKAYAATLAAVGAAADLLGEVITGRKELGPTPSADANRAVETAQFILQHGPAVLHALHCERPKSMSVLPETLDGPYSDG